MVLRELRPRPRRPDPAAGPPPDGSVVDRLGWVMVPALVVLRRPGRLRPAPPVGEGRRSASSDSSPVDLATPVDMADGVARSSAVVRAGDARIEVLSPTLLRLEYSPTGRFENSPTVNAVERNMPVPAYRSGVSDGWLTVRTSRAVLRYRVGSGPFTPENTSLRLSVAGHTTTGASHLGVGVPVRPGVPGRARPPRVEGPKSARRRAAT